MLLCLVCLAVFSSYSSAGQIIRFGWHQGGTLSLNKKRADILAKYLSNRLKMEVMAVQVKDLAALKQGLKENSLDVASIPNFSYPSLLQTVHILATSEFENKKRMFLYIIANKTSGITKVEDLKGKSASQVSKNNKLKCYFLAESIKANPKEYLGKVDTYKDLRDAVNAVAEGKVDSTCLSSTAWEILTRFDPSLKTTIRIIKRSPAYAMDPIVASRKLHESIWWNIQAVLISMSRDYAAQQILMQMGIQGFGSPVTDLTAYPSTLQPSKTAPVISAQPVLKKKVEEPVIAAATPELPVIKEAVTVAEKLPVSPSEIQVNTPEPTEKENDSISVAKTTAEETNQNPIVTPPVTPKPTTPVAQIQVQAPDTRSTFRKSLGNQLYMKGAVIALVMLLGLTILSMLRRSSKNKTLTVLLLMNNQIAALRSALDWKGKLHIESCHISDGVDPESILRLLTTTGHKPPMKLALILNSDRIIVKEFTFPLLTNTEIPAAIHWKLQDLNVPYNKETDTIHHTLIKKDRKQKQISLMAMIQPKNADEQEDWSGLPIKADSTLCVQMALLSRFRKCCPGGNNTRVMLAYRLNEQEALVLILLGENSFISRRIYATTLNFESEDFSATQSDYDQNNNVTDVWTPFLPELEQTINFQNRSSGNSLQTVFLSGLGVCDTPDPNNLLSDRFGVAVEGIDFLSDIEVSAGVREGCPAIEVLAGAALIYHKQAK